MLASGDGGGRPDPAARVETLPLAGWGFTRRPATTAKSDAGPKGGRGITPRPAPTKATAARELTSLGVGYTNGGAGLPPFHYHFTILKETFDEANFDWRIARFDFVFER